MNITEQHAKNDAALAEKLAALQAEFYALGEKQHGEAEALQLKHQKETEALHEKQQKETQASAEKLQGADANARETHKKEFDRINAEADKAHQAAIEKEQAAQAEQMASLSEESILLEQMRGMDADQIAKDFKKSEVVKVAESLSLPTKKKTGKGVATELEIAQRIYDAIEIYEFGD